MGRTAPLNPPPLLVTRRQALLLAVQLLRSSPPPLCEIQHIVPFDGNARFPASAGREHGVPGGDAHAQS